MKKNNVWRRTLTTCLSLLLCLAMMPAGAFAEGENNQGNVPAGGQTSSDIEINETNFPDENFRRDISGKFDKDEDGKLSTEEISKAKGINIYSISNLTGIEKFTNLEELSCTNGDLSTLDLSKNINLKTLDCSGNKLTSLDLSSNTALTSVNCSNNWLTSLTLPEVTEKNSTLTYLNCSYNQLTSLNLEEYTGLGATTNSTETGTAVTGLVAVDNVRTVLLEGENDSITLSDYFETADAGKVTNKEMDNCSALADNSQQLQITDKSEPATYTYTYNCGNNNSVDFTVKFAVANNGADKEIPLTVYKNDADAAGERVETSQSASFKTENPFALTGTGEIAINETEGTGTEYHQHAIVYYISIPMIASEGEVTGTLAVPAPSNYDKSDVSVMSFEGATINMDKELSDASTLVLNVTLERGKVSTVADKVEDNRENFMVNLLVNYNTTYSGGYSYTPAETVTNSTETAASGEAEKLTTADVTAKTSTDSDGSKTVNVAVNDTMAGKIIDKAVENKSDEVVIDATNTWGDASFTGKEKTEIELPESFILDLSDKTDASLIIKTDGTTIKLDVRACVGIANKLDKGSDSGDGKIIILQNAETMSPEAFIEKVKDGNLNLEKIKIKKNITMVSLGIKTSSGEIHDFGGGSLTCTINSGSDVKLKCLHIGDNYNYSTLPVLEIKHEKNKIAADLDELITCIKDIIKINNTIDSINKKVIINKDNRYIKNINFINEDIINIRNIENKIVNIDDITIDGDIIIKDYKIRVNDQIYLPAIKETLDQIKTSVKDVNNGYMFVTTHLSDFAIVDADTADDMIEAKEDKAAELIDNLSLKARAQKVKKGVKATVTADKENIKALEDLGYTVRYRYYRSTKKSNGYQARLEGTGKTYINTKGKSGTRYYYKAQARIYDNYGNLVAKTSLKQCKYTTRTFK